MSELRIVTFLRTETGFKEIGHVDRYLGDWAYVEGAITLTVSGAEVLGLDLWDDVNWLWPFVIQAIEECRVTGAGERLFPDQPIRFRAEKLWADNICISAQAGPEIDRKAVVSEHELLFAVAHAGLDFFDELERLCPGTRGEYSEREVLESWLESSGRRESN